jgi:hypothetical protein
MDRKETIVHETGNVGQLEIENLGDIDVFIQAGDIVKGGRQDRVIGVDLIVGKKSGRVPIPSFCVEHGRWRRRGHESDDHFSSSASYLASKSIKLSTKVAASQSEVWKSVANEQEKLSDAVKAPVAAAASVTSYQLTLEHEKVQERIKEGLTKLRPLLDQHRDAVGFAFSIRGELNSADAYVSHDLFKQLWDKLLTAAVTEAAAESCVPHEGKAREASADDVAQFLNKAPGDLTRERAVTPRVLLREYQNKAKAGFETEDLAHDAACVHTSVLSQ